MELTKKSDFVISTERSEWRNLLYRYVERCLDSRWSLDMTVNRHFLVTLICVKNNHYSVPETLAGESVLVKLYSEKLIILDDEPFREDQKTSLVNLKM